MRIEIDLTANEECYVTIKGEQIPCSREVYLAIKQPGRKEAMRKYRGQRPFINGRRCNGDCSKCLNFKGGKCELATEVSLNQLYEESDREPEACGSVEDEVHVNIMIEAMRKELESEGENCINIFSLMLEERPQRDIAEELGLADGTVTYYIKKIRKRLEHFRQDLH